MKGDRAGDRKKEEKKGGPSAQRLLHKFSRKEGETLVQDADGTRRTGEKVGGGKGRREKGGGRQLN